MPSASDPTNLLPGFKIRLAAAHEEIARIYREAGHEAPAKIAQMQAEWFRKQINEPLSNGAIL
jgi:hypothetical protein